MSIYNIPDELLIQMCEGWDTPTLLNMSQAYSRVYQVCEKVRNNRSESIDNLKQLIIDSIIDEQLGFIAFEKIDNGVTVAVRISRNPSNIRVVQGIYPKYKADTIPWILPGIRFTVISDLRVGFINGRFYVDKNGKKIYLDMEKLRQIAKNLIKQGYKIITEYKDVLPKIISQEHVEIIPKSINKVFHQRLSQIKKDFEELEEGGFLPNKCRNLLVAAENYLKQFEHPTIELRNIIDNILNELDNECSPSSLYERQRLGLLRGKLREYPVEEMS